MDERERARIRAAIDAAEGGGRLPPPTDSYLRAILANSHVIAIVGASPKVDRPSHGVLRALVAAGWQVLPINPAPQALAEGVAGLPSFPDLATAATSLGGRRIDLVDVFRRSEECAAVAEEAVAVRAGGRWLQLGVVSAEAAEIATAAGIPFVQDRCTAIEAQRLHVRGPLARD